MAGKTEQELRPPKWVPGLKAGSPQTPWKVPAKKGKDRGDTSREKEEDTD